MDEKQIQEIVDRLVLQITGAAGRSNPPAAVKQEHTYYPSDEPEKNMHGQDLKNEGKNTGAAISDDMPEDLSEIDLRKWYLTDHPAKPRLFMEMKAKTPARLGTGRAGARYKTKTMLRFRADHAAAQDTVFSDVDEDFIKSRNMIPVQTLCKDKDEYLTRPDLGRRFSEDAKAVIASVCGKEPQVLIIVGDGLSSAAIEANVTDMVPALKQGLSSYGIQTGDVLFIKYARVGAMDDIGELTGAKVICMLVGERPGLVTAESMSAYITYMPRHGIAESKRTVISNIHRGGTNPAEAGAHAAELISKMLEKKASGIDLKLLGV